MNSRPLPLSLRVVAYVTILFGVSCVIDVVVGLFKGRLSINLGVLQIPAGFGLLGLNRGWRTFVLFCLWLGFIVYGILAVAVAAGTRLTYAKFPEPWNRLDKGLSLLMAGALLAYMIWEYWVLTRPQIKRLFGLPS